MQRAIAAARHPIARLIGWLAISFVAAGVGTIASLNAGVFYMDLIRPEWAPPASIFGPVWTILYAMMGIAAWLMWREDEADSPRIAVVLFIVQLVLNALWSWLFFSWHLGALAFVDILVLWASILATIIAFWRIRPLAGAVLIPYLLWVSFASALNYSVWRLNPQLLGT
ncbi:MAG TPA: TspO/MBR family protein [Steroidobacteraceae bacterium]|nr:TspO/MBR family protein [Steroidobacteraceae bacterium]